MKKGLVMLGVVMLILIPIAAALEKIGNANIYSILLRAITHGFKG